MDLCTLIWVFIFVVFLSEFLFFYLALCLRLMARMAFALGDLTDALSQQHKAVMISERCNGFDHHETILDYVSPLFI